MNENLPQLINQLKDPDNPRSVINITPSSLSKALSFIPDSVFEMDIKELKTLGKCGEKEDKLRIAFWKEYDLAQTTGKKMSLTNIWKGNCSDVTFFKSILTNNFKLAYILTAPTDYLIQIEDIFQLGMQRMRQILEFEPFDKHGMIDPKIAEVQRKITEDAHLRYKGAIPYKVMSENLHLHKSVPVSGENKKLETPDELRARIKELEGGNALQEIEVTEVIDVENSQGES